MSDHDDIGNQQTDPFALFQHDILSSMREGCQVIGFDWQYIYVNAAAARQGRHTPGELLHHTMMEMYPGIQDTPLFQVMRDCMENRVSRRMENQFAFPDGGVGWFELSIQPAPQGILILSTDITGRKQAEDALRESERQMQALVSSLDDIVFEADERGTILNVWTANQSLLARPKAEILGRPVADILGEEFARPFLEGFKRVLATGQVEELEYTLDLAGEPRWFLGRISPIISPAGSGKTVSMLVRDITRRKRDEQEIHQFNERFGELVNNLTDIFWVSEPFTRRNLYISPAFESVVGLSIESVKKLPDGLLDVVFPEDRPILIEARDWEDKGVRTEMQFRIRRPDGSIRWIRDRGTPVLDEDGKVVRVVGIARDMTEQVEFEEQLRQSEERFRTLYETMLDGVIYQNRKGEIISANPAAERILGLTFDQMRGVIPSDPRWRAIHEDGSDFPGETHPAMLALSTGRAVSDVVMGIYNPQQNATTWLLVNAVPQFLPGEATPDQVYTTFRDITHQKQDEIITQNRLELMDYGAKHSLSELAQKAVDLICQMVASPLAFFYLLPKDRDDLDWLTWSSQALKGFSAVEKSNGMRAVLDNTGGWADVARQGRAAIYNDFASLPGQGDAPQSHPHISRVMIIPVLRDNRVVAIVGIGNKASDYSETDLEIVNRFADHVWDMVERKQTELALRLSEEKYRGLMESMDSIVVSVDYDGRFLYLNEAAVHQLGDTAERLTGKTMPDLFPEPVAPVLLENVRRVIRQDKGDVFEEQSIVQGELRWHRVSIQPIHDEQDRAVYALVNITDIHDLKAIQQELLELNRTLEERVRERAAEVQDLYDNAPTGYHSLDAMGNLVRINQTELDWLGYRREEVIGRPFSDFIFPAGLSTFQENFSTLKQRGWVRDLEYEFIRKNGSIFPILLNATAVYDADGNYVMSRSIVFDNTERKKAENALRQSEETYRAVYQNASDAIFLMDLGATIIQANPHCQELLGVDSPDEIIGRKADDFIDPSQSEDAALRGRQVLESQRIPSYERTFIRKDGSKVETEIMLSLIRDGTGKPRYMLSVVHDITTRKKHERNLRESEKQLRAANAALERAARMKDEFLASMSHELRTPLTGILGLSEALQLETYGHLSEKQRNALKNIQLSGRHLLDLINDILDLSKIEAGKLELKFEPCVLGDVCLASLQLIKGMAQHKHLQVHHMLSPESVIVRADARRLKQILVNLLSNAVKFTPENGEIGLEVQPDPSGREVRLVVWDKGIGIKAEDMPNLFKPFVQLDSGLAREYSGTGLGLSMVERLVNLHSGSIEVQSTFGEGSRFIISLPWLLLTPSRDEMQEDAVLGTRPLLLPVPGSAPLVLLADDNEVALRLFADFLVATGYRVAEARSGAELLEMAVENPPDLILVDIQMPGMDGLETLRHIRSHPDPHIAGIPVIALTALAMSGDRERCLKAGASAYISKPVKLKELAEVVHEQIEKNNIYPGSVTP